MFGTRQAGIRTRGAGIRAEVCDAKRCLELEPALANAREDFCGGLYAADDESGDAHLFVRKLAEKARQAGVQFVLGANIRRIHEVDGRIDRSTSSTRTVGASSRRTPMCCAWAASPLLLPRTAERLPIYPVKGYTDHGAGLRSSRAPSTSITDEARRIVVRGSASCGSPEQRNQRFSTDPNPRRSQALIDWLERYFPAPGRSSRHRTGGLRPATPSNLPIIGRSRLLNLWFNTGHGSLGWTLACGSAASLAAMMSGDRPEPRFPFAGARDWAA